MPRSVLHWNPERAPLRILLRALAAEITPVYVVGGVPRDVLLGRKQPLNDLDIVVAHSAIPIARRVADRLGWAFYPLDEARDVARLVFGSAGQPLICDIARMRGDSIEADLNLRDFTINSLAFEVSERPELALIDVTGGKDDLAARRLRRVNATSLADDPARLLRAVRFSVELGFPIEEQTRDQILRLAGSVLVASPERIRDELWKATSGHAPAPAVEQLRELGLLAYVLPEVAATDLVEQSAPHDKDVYYHTLAAVDAATVLRQWLLGRPVRFGADDRRQALWSQAFEMLDVWAYYLRQQMAQTLASGRMRAEWLIWHALFHDVGKPETRSVEVSSEGGQRTRFFGHEEVGAQLAKRRLEALRVSRLESETCQIVVRHHMRPHLLHESFRNSEISRRARFRFFRDVGPRGGDRLLGIDRLLGVDVLLLALADRMAINENLAVQEWKSYLVHVAQMLAFVFSEEGVESPVQRPLVDGRRLMQELQIEPGRELGQLLDELAEAQAAGEIVTADDALALAGRLVADRKRV